LITIADQIVHRQMIINFTVDWRCRWL